MSVREIYNQAKQAAESPMGEAVAGALGYEREEDAPAAEQKKRGRKVKRRSKRTTSNQTGIMVAIGAALAALLGGIAWRKTR